MLNSFVLIVACRYFRAKKNERFVALISGFSLLGVIIGVAALIIVMSVMNGFHRELAKSIIGFNGDVTIVGRDRTIEDYERVKQLLIQQNRIQYFIPYIAGQGFVLGPRNSSGALLRGIDRGDLILKQEVLQNLIAGTVDDFIDNVIVIGSELAYTLGVQVGDSVRLISPHLVVTAFGSIPRFKQFKVSAIFTCGMYEYDAATIFMPIVTARKFLSYSENTINTIEVHSKHPEGANLLTEELKDILGYYYIVASWEQSNIAFLNALAIERTTMFTILSLIIIVAALNIVSSLIMLVKDKTKDIAILKTIGASSKQIMLIFVYNGMFIGIIGTAIGVLLGTGIAYNLNSIRNYLEQITNTKIFDAAIYFLYSLPSDVRSIDIILVVTLSIVLCLLATIYPAYRASRLNPAEALRYYE